MTVALSAERWAGVRPVIMAMMTTGGAAGRASIKRV
jgi:hypothetical protein